MEWWNAIVVIYGIDKRSTLRTSIQSVMTILGRWELVESPLVITMERSYVWNAQGVERKWAYLTWYVQNTI